MKVIITEESLDSLLNVQISVNGGQSYSNYAVSSLKGDGLTFDCSPKDLKVICDVNTLKYIQVLADGEKASSSDIDLSNYIKIKDIYVDLYKNPYFNKTLTEEEIDNLPRFEQIMYDNKDHRFCCIGKDFEPGQSNQTLKLVAQENDSDYEIRFDDFYNSWHSDNNGRAYYFIDNENILCNTPYFNLICPDVYGYVNESNSFLINERVHFIKHF